MVRVALVVVTLDREVRKGPYLSTVSSLAGVVRMA
jgi:hypothetical protein